MFYELYVLKLFKRLIEGFYLFFFLLIQKIIRTMTLANNSFFLFILAKTVCILNIKKTTWEFF